MPNDRDNQLDLAERWFRGEVLVHPPDLSKPIAHWGKLIIDDEKITVFVSRIRLIHPSLQDVEMWNRFKDGVDEAADLSQMFASMKGEEFQVEAYLGEQAQIVLSITAVLTEWDDKKDGDRITATFVPKTAIRLAALERQNAEWERRIQRLETLAERETE